MFGLSLVVALLLSVPTFAQVTNANLLPGTWSTGSGAVLTGPGFCTPENTTFNYPQNTGVSVSFTTDGYYELARYRFKSNATKHKCITGVLNWHHGTYVVDQTADSITLNPFGDGYQQIQNVCEAVTNFIENYNQTEFYPLYQIFQDPTDGYKLHLFDSTGAPYAPMFYKSATPIMNPTKSLRNISSPVGTGSVKVQKRNAGDTTYSPASAGLTVLALIVTLAGGVAGPLFL
ncbi:chaperone for protein-folding within the ER, fungal-domain-containing protein [Thelephora terrestris]|uniref:Protein ROT1 n=1 Tax=Thelephora terrestris TaxID=56493 RepID=A0A9P6H6P9_9AGAM|nr:chaperone for protein-folding within the ER, fungal-domain-containing protein [Thelephora terrestris]